MPTEPTPAKPPAPAVSVQPTDEPAPEAGKDGHRQWGRRFSTALAALGAPDQRQRMLSRVVLTELARSSYASAEERALVHDLLDVEARYDPAAGSDLRGLADDVAERNGVTFYRSSRTAPSSVSAPTGEGRRATDAPGSAVTRSPRAIPVSRDQVDAAIELTRLTPSPGFVIAGIAAAVPRRRESDRLEV